MDSFCKIWPRKRLTGFTLVSGTIWSAPYEGTIDDAWIRYDVPLTEATSSALSDGDWFHDGETFYVDFLTNPDLEAYPGVTIEFVLYLADKDNTYYSTPTDTTTDLVDWDGGLTDIPRVTNGSTETLYGIAPLQSGSITYANGYGELNEILHSCSFNYARVEAWHNGAQTFLGYINGFTVDSDNIVTFKAIDFMYFFDREFNMGSGSITYNTIEHPLLDLNYFGAYKRIVYGMVNGFKPVNISYNATASTTNNRTWATHQFRTGDTVGTVTQSVNHLGANLPTVTYLTSNPQYLVGDEVIIVNNGVTYYATVIGVNRSLNYITHENLGARTFTALDTVQRYFIGSVKIADEDDVLWVLKAGRDYTVFTDATNLVCGFVLTNNFEATLGFTHTPFDPTKHTLYVRVYGHKDLPQYEDATDVGSISNYGGIASEAVSVLYDVITRGAGFSPSDIYKETFADVGSDSFPVGIAIPSGALDTELPTCKELIETITGDVLWALGFFNDPVANKLKLSLMAYRPFVSTADYTVDKDDIVDFNFSVDYADTYNYFKISYETTEIKLSFIPDNIYFEDFSNIATNLHLSTKRFIKQVVVYDADNIQTLIKRFKYALGERRGIYNLVVSNDYINNTNLGVSYGINREQLPGFAYEMGTVNSRQTALVEVQKSVNGVSISLDDQLGIQDNSGSW